MRRSTCWKRRILTEFRRQANPFAEFCDQMFVAESQTLGDAPNRSPLGPLGELA